MSEHFEEFVEGLREARTIQIEKYGDDVAVGKGGEYMLLVLQQELGEVARAAISGTQQHSRAAVVGDLTSVQERLVSLGAAVAATWEMLQRDADAFRDPDMDVYVVPRSPSGQSDINNR
jgi:NTP pyrophosphatase (non-canonical NTP hydrolase)